MILDNLSANTTPAVRAWAAAALPQPVVAVEPVGGGITRTKWLLRLGDGDRVVLL